MKQLKTATGGLIVLFMTTMNVFSQDTLHLRSDKMEMVIANNQSYGDSHRAGYNGISEISLKNGSEKNLFKSPFSGLNLEFIFSGDSTSYDWDIFEPRKSPMQLTRLTSQKVRLEQSQTENWPLQSTITFELSHNVVDMTYEGVALDDIWKKYQYIGLFFASYIDGPEKKGIHFIGRTRSGEEEPEWIYHLPRGHGQAANHRPKSSNWDPPYDPALPLRLVSGFSDYEYSYPFYYGRTGENVIIMMFRNPDENSELRFAQSPNGGGPDDPAWDFIYFKKEYEVNKKFNFKVGMIIKKFEGKEDVIQQYEQWSGNKVAYNPTPD